MRSDGEKTNLTVATSKSRSLRTTVPAGIVRQFNLTEEDALEWKIEAKDNELVIVVRPVKTREKRSS